MYDYTVMSFGLTNVSAYFMYLMNKVFMEYLDKVFMRGLHCFKVRGKLIPRFIGWFKILEKIREVACQLELPLQLSEVHDVFHVSQLKKCLCVPEEQIPMKDLDAKDLSYQEYPVKILETSERVTQNKKIKMCKVQ
jgi:hypothetical protein